MRTFIDIRTAGKEICRDLYKAPIVETERAQGTLLAGATHELLMYSYVLSNLPSLEDTIELLKIEFSDSSRVSLWLKRELDDRLAALFGEKIRESSDDLHPELQKIPDELRGYTYQERLFRKLSGVQYQFRMDLHNRRAFVPIFHPGDLSSPERVPCSLGYQYIYRSGLLHCIYLQRSCDFERFWPSDVYFAGAILKEVAAALKLRSGYLYHTIISLHSYINEEVY